MKGVASRLESESLGARVFDAHPYGLVLSDVSGAVLALNPAAVELLGDALADAREAPRPLCLLLGCRSPGSPLDDVCLHELAVAQDGPLPEVRVDLPENAGADAAWVTARRMPDDPEHQQVLLELRPGAAGDRRRRTAPHWTSGARLQIITLGRTRLLGNEGPLDGRWLSNRPGKILKLLVAQRGRTVYVDEIAEKLWPGNAGASVEGLRYFVHALRGHLEPGPRPRGKSSFVVAQPGGYALDGSNIEVDADLFEEHIAAGGVALKAGDDETAERRLAAGMELYGGDFLADEPYAEWALDERDRLHGIASEALRSLADIRQRAGDLEGASRELERLTELEPFDVEAHAELLRVLIRRGRRSEVVRRYAALRHRLLATFGEDVPFALADVTAPD
jgi:DNA-binding SARP family transcriptional activator